MVPHCSLGAPPSEEVSMRLWCALLALIALSIMPLTGEARGGQGGGHSRSYSPRIREYHERAYAPRVRSSAPRARAYAPRYAGPGATRAHSRSYAPRSSRSRHGSDRTWYSKYDSNPYARHGEDRSLAEKHLFWERSGHPHGWPGHVVDHIIPLACGGSDAPSNMQWQTIADGKAKDKWERKSCQSGRHR
jgi:5-methylcytosine-specific restriction endonuclease McrA